MLIFTNGSGTPEQIDACDYNGTAGYDPRGNLWLECLTKGSSSILELPKGGGSFQSVAFDHSLYYLGAIQWDGKYLDVSLALNNANYYTEDICPDHDLRLGTQNEAYNHLSKGTKGRRRARVWQRSLFLPVRDGLKKAGRPAFH